MGEPRVVPGRLVEQPSLLGAGVERAAHGEFIGAHGELASYAFGWSTAGSDHQGRLTIGIGAGNEGGGTFHAVVVNQEGSYGIGLVDEPFADVPEGGPDLTRAEALAHEDLPYIWHVADVAMDQDPRARWFLHWLHGTEAIVTPEVESGAEPILYVSNDDDDHLWQGIGSSDADGATGVILHLWHLVDADPTLLPVLALQPGESAWRDGPNAPWQRNDD